MLAMLQFTNAATPMGKVMQLLSDLQAKITSEGAADKRDMNNILTGVTDQLRKG